MSVFAGLTTSLFCFSLSLRFPPTWPCKTATAWPPRPSHPACKPQHPWIGLPTLFQGVADEKEEHHYPPSCFSHPATLRLPSLTLLLRKFPRLKTHHAPPPPQLPNGWSMDSYAAAVLRAHRTPASCYKRLPTPPPFATPLQSHSSFPS
jgi:hypothetical protein